MAGTGEYTISDWPDELFTVSRTTIVLRAPHDGRLACSARRSFCVLRTTVGH